MSFEPGCTMDDPSWISMRDCEILSVILERKPGTSAEDCENLSAITVGGLENPLITPTRGCGDLSFMLGSQGDPSETLTSVLENLFVIRECCKGSS